MSYKKYSRPSFRYKEYEKASLKHLKACQAMLAGLSCKTTTISVAEKEYLLMDIFYLSSYTLECIINYAILKLIYKQSYNKWHDNESVRKVVDPNYSFAFKSKDQNGNKYRFYIESHNFWNNIDLLNQLLSGNTIPLISNKKNLPPNHISPIVLDMIESWEARSRYHTYPKYNEKEIRDLVELTEQVYNAIINPLSGVGL